MSPVESSIQREMPGQEQSTAREHAEGKQAFGPTLIDDLTLDSVYNPKKDSEPKDDNAAQRGTTIKNSLYNQRNTTEQTEPMDWTPIKSDATLPSPGSRSGSESPANVRTVAINLFPLTDSAFFNPKRLMFSPNEQIKVGRVSGSRNQKEATAENGVFICDVMSREHAVLREENGKVHIRDTKSTHGTFINNIRLGDGTKDSEWRELNHGDVITFGHSVKRNQNLYKHLSAYVFYPKEKRGLPSIPDIVPSSSKEAIEAAKRLHYSTEERAPPVIAQVLSTGSNKETSIPVVNVKKAPGGSTEIVNDKVAPTSSDQKTSSSNNRIGNEDKHAPALPVRERETTDSIAITIEPERQTKLEKKAKREIAVKEEIVQPNDFRTIAEDNKPVTPANTPPTDTSVDNNTANNALVLRAATVSFATPIPVTGREKVPPWEVVLRQNKVDDKCDEYMVSNGEGPSHINETLSTSTLSRKRKIDEIYDYDDFQQIAELTAKIAVIEENINKRRRWDLISSTMIGMAAGAVGVGISSYFLGM